MGRHDDAGDGTGDGTGARRRAAERARRGLARAVRRVSAGALLLALGGCAAIYDARYNLANPWQDEGPPIPDYVIDSGLHWRPAGWLDDARLVLAEPPGNPQRLAIWRPFEDPSGQALEPVALREPVGELGSFWRLRCLRDGWVRYPAGKAPDPQSGQRLHQDWWGRVDGAHRLVVPYREVEGVPDPLVANPFTCGIERLPVETLPANLAEEARNLEPLLSPDAFLMGFDMSQLGSDRRWEGEDMVVLGLPRGASHIHNPDEYGYAPWRERYFFQYPAAAFAATEGPMDCAPVEELTPDLRIARRYCLPDRPGLFPWQVVRGGFVAVRDAGYYREPGSQYEAGILLSDLEGRIRKLLSGHIIARTIRPMDSIVSVSPSGCRIAVLHSPTTAAIYFRLDAEPDWQRDDTAKVIDLCAAADAVEALPSIEVTAPN